MDNYTSFETVKEKLITAGIKELENHGITDFSLRRVATLCNVSCAAPYKHFKSKENFIAEIILYILSQWSLLEKQVAEIFKDDIKKQITETCVAYIKFWIANPNFRSVLMINPKDIDDERITSQKNITNCIKYLIHDYCIKNNIDEDTEIKKAYTVRSLIYGAVLMIDNGEITNSDETIDMIRKSIEEQI